VDIRTHMTESCVRYRTVVKKNLLYHEKPESGRS
jgi:hypothetical protein